MRSRIPGGRLPAAHPRHGRPRYLVNASVGIGIAARAALAPCGTDRVGVSLQADGDLLYCASALWTVAHEQLSLLMVTHNNRGYHNSAEHMQRMARRRGRPLENYTIGTALENPAVDFSSLARGFGIWPEDPVERAEELRPAVARVLAQVKAGRPALVDVVTRPR